METSVWICSLVGKGAWPKGFRKSACVACEAGIWLRNQSGSKVVAICPGCYNFFSQGRNSSPLRVKLGALKERGLIGLDLVA